MGLDVIDARMFDVTGDIFEMTTSMDRGFEKSQGTIKYSGVRSKYLNPLKTDTSETYEMNQQVAKIRASWLFRNEASRTITPNKMAYVVDGEHHEITGVRKYKGNRNLLVMDTILRDNQTL